MVHLAYPCFGGNLILAGLGLPWPFEETPLRGFGPPFVFEDTLWPILRPKGRASGPFEWPVF